MKAFSQVATTLLGLLAGGMVLIALGLVPYWRAIDPAEFTTAFAASLPTVGGTMMILTLLATGSMILAAGVSTWKKAATSRWLIGGAVGTLVMLITVPLYFGAANSLLASGELGASEISSELAKWQQLHWFRTAVSVVALYCAVRSGYAQPSNAS